VSLSVVGVVYNMSVAGVRVVECDTNAVTAVAQAAILIVTNTLG